MRRAGGPPPPRGPQIASHVSTVGVRRPAWGQAGRPLTVHTNHFQVKVPKGIIHHYDVINSDDKALPAALNLEIIRELQRSRPDVFTPKVVYDGRKNIFAIRELPLRKLDSRGYMYEDFQVAPIRQGDSTGKPPKDYKVRLTKVAQINPEVLHGFLAGRQSHDSAVLTAITALNVVIRMLPISKYPFNARSFFTDAEKKDIGGGFVLWRGYFQSIRPGGTNMYINIDISTGTMYKPGTLIDLCLESLNCEDPQDLTVKGGFNEKYRAQLQRFIAGVKIYTTHTAGQTLRVVKKITLRGAREITFKTREGQSMTVADYFRSLRTPINYPYLPCVEVGSGALIPIELCVVPKGQLMRKQVPSDKTKDVLTFASQKPPDRLRSIVAGLQVFEYGTSEYLRSFGMEVNTNAPLSIPARVLQPPNLMYGSNSRQRNIRPDNGAWNMRDKHFYTPAGVKGWMMAIYERTNRFPEKSVTSAIKGLREAGEAVGMLGLSDRPMVKYLSYQGQVDDQLKNLGTEWLKGAKDLPALLVIILPENAADLYTAVKHFGDITAGVATQCLKANKCSRANQQYYANVCLKINVKLGGINCVPYPQDVPVLTDPSNPTIILGADVIHPAPGSGERPSFTALVGSIDPDNAKYVARTNVQESRVEMIQDMKTMMTEILQMYRNWRGKGGKIVPFPKRIIFYRDGVSEGQFQQVLDYEVKQIKAACAEAGGGAMPKITVIVVGKRHHVRFFPQSKQDADNSGNCRAGTVVDKEISHPTEFDFYLQSHGGLLGTSRPAHYSVLLDENKFSVDALQQLSFALCHVYARSTRSVSIPAPVYYADIVCSRAKNHFDPKGILGNVNLEESGPSDPRGTPNFSAFKKAYLPIHGRAMGNMYFT